MQLVADRSLRSRLSRASGVRRIERKKTASQSTRGLRVATVSEPRPKGAVVKVYMGRHKDAEGMKFHYCPETDSLYIDLSEKASTDTREVAPGVVLDFDAEGRLVGIEALPLTSFSVLQRS